VQHCTDAQADVAREGRHCGGGTPREFTTITVTDGIAMGHAGMKSSLAPRRDRRLGRADHARPFL
jgi:dihydroxyacid dehydratase/phosphogluconate dehydratase